jgi:WhiB family redox-sensing transcriptional regulator
MAGRAPDTTTGSTATTDWRHDAACRDMDGELWFPIGENPAAVTAAKKAKAICATCPVVMDCGTWAIQTRQPAGIWGGIDENERAAHLRRKTRQRRAGAKPQDFDGRREEIGRALHERHQTGETINAIATAEGLTWWTVHALVGEGRAAS